ncbi:MAG: hypothetical protein JWO13_2286 [Acidobacteriales bacterium]|nr:hypothetical protein [Terriglobales bacterium]
MASKRRQRRKACSGHRQHETMAKAIIARDKLRVKHPGEDFNAFGCIQCGKFHAAHTPKKIREIIDERRGIR